MTAVNRAAGTITFNSDVSTITGISVGDHLVREGDYDNVITGFGAWLPTTAPTTSLFGCDRTQDVDMLGGVRSDGTNKELVEALDHCYTIYPSVFGSSAMSSYLVDPRADIDASHVKSDDIHPTYAGSVILAHLIWDEMVAQGVYR